jgi:predicted secreted hydrolase
MTPGSRRWLLCNGFRSVLAAQLGLANGVLHAGAVPQPAAEVKPRRLEFPRDGGAHPAFKTEWWYITGWLGANDALYGFQIKFFRSRVDGTQAMQSRLAARQLLFAHAAVTDVQGRRMWHDQRIARWSGEAPGQNPADAASASTQDTGVVLRDWSLLRAGDDLHARISTDKFAMDLRFGATQAVLLQGNQGLSRKGPDVRQSSYYYSLPQ